MLHHDFQESDDDFTARSNDNLAFAGFLCVIYALQSIAKYAHSHHDYKLKQKPSLKSIEK